VHHSGRPLLLLSPAALHLTVHSAGAPFLAARWALSPWQLNGSGFSDIGVLTQRSLDVL